LAKSKTRSRIHITAVASSAARDVERLGPGGIQGMLALARAGVGSRYDVTASERMIFSKQTDATGGRSDDRARAREIQTLLADERVAGLVTLRGGAWFTRILDRIDFDVLSRRRRMIHIFGFSEMTTLVSIAGKYPKVVGVYDLGPGFLFGGAERYAQKHVRELTRAIDLPAGQHAGFAAGWALARYPQAFTDFFRDVADILDGSGSQRVPTGRLLAGAIPRSSRISIAGGTLSVLLPLVGSRYASAVETRGKWIALEDTNEAADPIDRMMAGLKLNGLFERAEGVILGDFHDKDKDLTETAFRLLQHHLPAKRRLPIISLQNFGHTYPIAPLPLHREVTLKRTGASRVRIEIPWSQWAQD